MKKGANIFFLTLATLMFLVLTIVPHHHHNGGVCIIKEKCEQELKETRRNYENNSQHLHNELVLARDESQNLRKSLKEFVRIV